MHRREFEDKKQKAKNSPEAEPKQRRRLAPAAGGATEDGGEAATGRTGGGSAGVKSGVVASGGVGDFAKCDCVAAGLRISLAR
nr:hypothetical protein Itr_chr10CG19090 [Ipomoea trifida]